MPDALVVVADNDCECRAFVEIDLGSGVSSANCGTPRRHGLGSPRALPRFANKTPEASRVRANAMLGISGPLCDLLGRKPDKQTQAVPGFPGGSGGGI